MNAASTMDSAQSGLSETRARSETMPATGYPVTHPWSTRSQLLQRVGMRLGRFVLESPAGRGGMGAVFRARDTTTGEAAAVKVVARVGVSEVALLTTLSSLRHPKIVQYFDAGVTPDGEPWVAMEWLEGEDLASRLASGPLCIRDTLAVIKSLAGALAWAHQRGVIHRDLKPANTFLRDGSCDQAILVDFGIARSAWSAEPPRASGFLGTRPYAAPEQLLAPEAADARADVFSLGCILYECLSGRCPDRTGAVVEKQAAHHGAQALAQKGVSEGLRRMLESMLADDPGDRPADGSEVLARLRILERSLVSLRRSA